MIEPKALEQPVEIPSDQISGDALAGIIENFILREGTDYGGVEVTFEKKVEQIRRQIERSEIKIVFDLSTETLTLLTKTQFLRLMNASSKEKL